MVQTGRHAGERTFSKLRYIRALHIVRRAASRRRVASKFDDKQKPLITRVITGYTPDLFMRVLRGRTRGRGGGGGRVRRVPPDFPSGQQRACQPLTDRI